MAAGFYWALGSRAVRAEGEKTSLDYGCLGRHAAASAALMAFYYSLLGLAIGNLPRFIGYLGDTVGPILFMTVLLVGVALPAAVWALRARRQMRFPCPHCKNLKPPLLIKEMGGLSSRLPGFAGAFFQLRRCPDCSGLATRLGVAAAPALPTFRTLAWPWSRAIMTTAASAAVGIIVAGLFWNGMGSLRLEAARKQVRRAGFKTGIPENRPKPRDEDNAVTWYKKAGKAYEAIWTEVRYSEYFKKKSENEFAIFYLGRAELGAQTPEETAAARKLVAKRRNILAMLATGASKKEEHWGVDWDKRPTYLISIPEYANPIPLQYLLAIRATLEASDGRIPAALKDLCLALKLARSVGSEPMLISQMIEFAMSGIAMQAAVPVLRRAGLEQAKAALEPFLSDSRLLDGFLKSMALYHYGFAGGWGDMTWREAWRKSHQSDPLFESVWLFLYWPFLKLDIASAIRGNLNKVEALYEQYPKSKTEYDKASEEFKRTVWFLAQMIVPAFDDPHTKVLAQLARQRLALAALAVLAFKEKNKRWPDALWEVDRPTLYPKRFEDPFTGGSFKLLRVRDGLVIYSVGPDGIDEQGAPYDRWLFKGDIAWRL